MFRDRTQKTVNMNKKTTSNCAHNSTHNGKGSFIYLTGNKSIYDLMVTNANMEPQRTTYLTSFYYGI